VSWRRWFGFNGETAKAPAEAKKALQDARRFTQRVHSEAERVRRLPAEEFAERAARALRQRST
jgi:hypothetical protein